MGEKHVLRPANVLAVQSNARDSVESLGQQFNMLVIAKARSHREPASIVPIALLDPLEFLLVGSPKGIRDSLVPEKIVVNAAGNLGGQPVSRGGFEERPGSQGEDFLLH
jgi:hypothetical protein